VLIIYLKGENGSVLFLVPAACLTCGLILSTIGLIMSAKTRDDSISSALFGRIRCAVLALLFSHTEESFYLRQIERIIGSSHGAVYRELGNLVKVGLVVRNNGGNQVYYQANSNSPVFNELRGLIMKTAGVADVLRNALAPLAGKISAAFIYGSYARGEERASSDIDVMVIGGASFGDVVSALNPAQDQLGREINPSVFTLTEFNERIGNKEHFITSVMRAPKIMLLGEESELRTVA
jgi:predicted nucleotidyltransferase